MDQIIFIPLRSIFFQGLLQQVRFELQLLALLQMHDLAAPTGLIDITGWRYPILGSLVDRQELGFCKVLSNRSDLAKDIFAL